MTIKIEDFYGSDDVIIEFPNIYGRIEHELNLEDIVEKNGFYIADFEAVNTVRVQPIEKNKTCISLIENLIKEYL
jgi:hypothetical protein